MALGSMLSSREKFRAPTLEITSMMDMFTIIVFFLLFSFSENPEEIDMSAEISLPESSATLQYKNSIKLFLSATSLKLEEEVIAIISNGEIDDFDQEKPKESLIFRKLEKLRYDNKKQYALALIENSEQNPGDVSKPESKPVTEPHILFFCDKAVPYKMINTITKIAALAGYPNLQLAVSSG